MKTQAEYTKLRAECYRQPCWEIRWAGLVWYISAESREAAVQKWTEVSERPAGKQGDILRVRRAYEPCGD